jgi:hypothetical protein
MCGVSAIRLSGNLLRLGDIYQKLRKHGHIDPGDWTTGWEEGNDGPCLTDVTTSHKLGRKINVMIGRINQSSEQKKTDI